MMFLRTLIVLVWASISLQASRLDAELVLFAIQEDGAIAGSLPYGPDMITESDSAYLATYLGPEMHDRWLQRGVDGTGNTLYEIDWQFSDVKTVANRFQDAVDVGETVAWTVTSPLAPTQTYSGTWRFSSTADNLSSKFDGSSGTNFVTETFFGTTLLGTGIWGAGPGVVDGGNGDFDEATAAIGWNWGFGNLNGSDIFDGFANSGTLLIDGNVQSTLPAGFKNYMYVDRATAVPEPSSLAFVGIAIATAFNKRRRRFRAEHQKTS